MILISFCLFSMSEGTKSFDITKEQAKYCPKCIDEGIVGPLTPKKAVFSENRCEALRNGSPIVEKLTIPELANYISTEYAGKLIPAWRDRKRQDDSSFNFSPRILTCKAFKESTFNTQIDAESTSAAGLTQVVDVTGADVFKRFIANKDDYIKICKKRGFDSDECKRNKMPFRSKITKYAHIDNYADYKKAMAKDPRLQLELGLVVLEMKRTDNPSIANDIKGVLSKYYGSQDPVENQKYAEQIFDCASCAKQSNGFTMDCLCRVKGDYKKCIKSEYLKIPATCSKKKRET